MRTRLNFGLALIILATVFTSAASVSGQTAERSYLFPVALNEKHGYIDKQGQMVIPPRFDLVKTFSEGLAPVAVRANWGYIDQSGEFVIAPRFSMARNFSEGLAAVLLKGRYGFINCKGKLVIEPQFEKAGDFSEGLARVKRNGRWAFINKSGETVFVAPFDYVDDFRGGFSVVAKRFDDGTSMEFAHGNVKVSFIDRTGKLSSIGWLTAANRFSEGLSSVSTDSNIIAGFYYGDLVLDNLDTSNPPSSVLNPVRYSFINTNGQKVFEGTYEQVSDFAEGLAAVRIKDKWGYINNQGQLVIPARFDGAESFSEGLAYVALGDDRYFIDTSGKIMFKAEFSLLTPFTNGLAEVLSCATLPCKTGYINKTGEFVWQSLYHDSMNSLSTKD